MKPVIIPTQNFSLCFSLTEVILWKTKPVGPSQLASSIHKHSDGVRSAGSLRLAKSWELSGRNHVMCDIWSPWMPYIEKVQRSKGPVFFLLSTFWFVL